MLLKHMEVSCVVVVENMCHFDADGKRYHPFGRGSGSQFGVPHLFDLPIRPTTFPELKKRESSLLKEMVYLEKEITNKNANFELEKAKNEIMKCQLDFVPKWHSNPSSTIVEL